MTASTRSLWTSALALAVLAAAAGGILAAAGAAPVTSPDGLWSWSRPVPLGAPLP